MLGPTRFIGAAIFAVAHPVSIGVGTTIGQRRAGFIRAGIGVIEHPIAIPIPLARCRTAVAFRQTRFMGTDVHIVSEAVSVPVGAAASGVRAGHIRTWVNIIGHAIAVLVPYFEGFHVDRGVGPAALAIERPDSQGVGARRDGLPAG
jgi:hypothetical protein